MDSFSPWITPNNSAELFFIGKVVLKHATSLTYRSWKLRIDPDFRLLYHVLMFPLKVVGNILHITSLSWMTSSRLPLTFWRWSRGSVSSSYVSRLVFADKYSLSIVASRYLALYMFIKYKDNVVVKVFINNGFALNVLPYHIMGCLPIDLSHIKHNHIMTHDYDGTL